jgi:hypothetical protein
MMHEPFPQPNDERLIAEAAVALMTQFNDVPGLSLTPPQACRLVNAEPRASRVALDRLHAAGWLVKSGDGRYRRAATLDEIVEAALSVISWHQLSKAVSPNSPVHDVLDVIATVKKPTHS